MKTLLSACLLASVAFAADPPPQTATVYAYRTKVKFMARALRPSIYCDGIEIQRLANGTFLSHKVPAGKHMISAGRTEVGQLVDLEAGKEYFFKLDHKNVFVSNWSGRQPMTLTVVPADTARREMDGLKKVGGE
jgi:hypothetical protein